MNFQKLLSLDNIQYTHLKLAEELLKDLSHNLSSEEWQGKHKKIQVDLSFWQGLKWLIKLSIMKSLLKWQHYLERIIELLMSDKTVQRLKMWNAVSCIYHQLQQTEQFGYSDGNELRDFFDKKITKVTNVSDCTFGELHNIIIDQCEKHGSTNLKDLWIAAVNLKTLETKIFSWEETPNVIIADAVRCSMAIPLIFTPHRGYIKPPGKKRSLDLEHKDDLYVDGGMVDNYPIWVFDDKEDKNALGFRLVTPFVWEQYVLKADSKSSIFNNSLIDYIITLMKIYGNKQESDFKNRGNLARSVVINTKHIGALDFDLLKEDKERLIACGIEGANDYISNCYSCTFFKKPKHTERTPSQDS